MKNILKISFLVGMAFFLGCSSDGGGTPSVSDITLTTNTPQSLGGINITTGGRASSNINSYNYGICYSTSPGPTILSFTQSGTQTTNLDFTCTIPVFELGSTYYIKAYIQDINSGEVKYGNEVSISIPLSLSTGIVKGISSNGFNVDITVGSDLSTNTERGVVYGGGQNPKVGDAGTQSFPINDNGAGTFNFTIEDYSFVVPNRAYNIRSYAKMGNQYYYGNQQSFRTTGYVGGSGGYVFYDKGQTTNGWRYLEAYSSTVQYNSSSYFYWSCNTNFIPGISNEIGTGKENSQIIKSVCNFTNVASALSLDMTYNGQAAGTWFIPSINELKELYKMKVTGIMNFGTGSITIASSSQSSDIYCFVIPFSGGSPGTTGTVQLSGKQWSAQTAWPIRRF